MSPQPKRGTGKRAAIDFDAVVDKPLDQITAADFLRILQERETPGQSAATENLTVRDVVHGGSVAGLHWGPWPEKKKIEREKWPLEKFAPEKLLVEGFHEKKKFELEKLPFEKQMVEHQVDIRTELGPLADRLAAIEAKLSALG